ncbi:unnamed protein product [Angiostrongylus costaricensis]|uniref:Tr-type G domain-containing protein n=1 Tax=Angiostrongylus costaricensis TaxID=334426 RepID=A0A0R3Q1W9_ANGCS|nr:unnamed protein product [Angiostrongylus costaricensis]
MMTCLRGLQVLRVSMKRFASLAPKVEEARMSVSPAEIRNIGIVAHIDAGKTTVTERMLYLAGVIRHMGDVDSGDTVTDFLDLERERVEVERCARILDGVITVLDGSAGVQAQTMTVWRQAAKFRLPSTFFVNKLDKREANFEESVDSMEQKLGVKALVVGSPYYSDGVIGGVVDVIAKKHIPMCVEGQWNNVELASHVGEVFSTYRERLCCDLSDLDQEFMSLFLEKYNGDAVSVPSPVIIKALRRMTLANLSTVVGAGSALRCPASIRSLLDHAIHFLPSPEERNTALKKLFDKELCALIFKIGHDKRKGKLSFVRVYTGVLNNNTFVYNSSRQVAEGPIKVRGMASADEDTTSEDTDDSLSGDQIVVESFGEVKNVVLKGIDSPEPVYFCSVEPPSSKSIHEFERALKELAVEDPSLRIRFDTETGQIVVETMGELHMDVVKNRLIRDYGLNVFVGPLQVRCQYIVAVCVL